MLNLEQLLNAQNKHLIIEGVSESFMPFALAQIIEKDGAKRPIIFVARDNTNLENLAQNLKFVAPDVKYLIFPPWDCLPYDRVGPSLSIVAQRLKTLANIVLQKELASCFILTTVNAISQKLLPYAQLKQQITQLSAGEIFSMENLIAKLEDIGYERCATVTEIGNYAVRGGLLDVFLVGSKTPFRLDFFGDKLETIKSFDVATQRTIALKKRLQLIPLSEVFLNNDTVTTFRKNYIKTFGAAKSNDALYDSISHNRRFIGMEHWASFFYEKMESIFDYVPNAIVVFEHLTEQSINHREKLIKDYYQARHNQKSDTGFIYNALIPNELYLTKQDIFNIVAHNKKVELCAFKTNDEADKNIIAYEVNIARNFISERKSPDINLFEVLVDYLGAERAKGNKVLLASWSEGSQARLLQVLNDHGLEKIIKVNNFADALKADKSQIVSTILCLETGFVYNNLIVLSEQDIFGDRLIRQNKKAKKNANYIISANSLTQGDIVVHIKHGIGRFVGLRAIEALGVIHDCIELHYAGGDRLFIPVENIELLSRYGGEASSVVLDKLGGVAWQARKARLKKQLLVIAGDLINIAAERKLKKAPAMIVHMGAYDEFVARFPYEETEDQDYSIKAVIEDLAAGTPMDRLICGDVGFGKTEVCLRAAFIAAMSGYQVAVIVPTTLLARQHFKNFKTRFEGFPIEVAQLSRLCSAKDRTKVREGIANGTIDIVVGTHALFSKTLNFKNLGLLVIDEEHHFGVKHKERLKELKRNIHVLTLSATPIPRTLQFSLIGIKELSLITTPPVDRLAVHTFVAPFDSLSIKETLLREYHRGGQSFFVCPRISDLTYIEEFLHKHLPELKYAIAHGQMPPTQLEDIMNGFYDGMYNVLLSTSIVESGLDVPTANTIIIYKADMFGLAALYQLRGRVGRSKQRAYALYTFSGDKLLTKDAEKRLKILQTIDGLGGGFQLASFDMDIRGAGNLLGEEQSGHIKEVGYELYQQMLEEAILELRDHNIQLEEKWAPQINIGSSVLISEEYVSDMQLRLNLYQRLSLLEELEEIEVIAAEMIDRFGPIPIETENLLKTIYIKALCKKINVEKVDAAQKGVIISFKDNKFANPEALLNYLSKLGSSATIRADQSIFFAGLTNNSKMRIGFTIKILKNLVDLL